MTQKWIFERSSGYAGWRCTKCAEWKYNGQKLECKCADKQLPDSGNAKLTKIWINEEGFCGKPELRLDWSNDRHQSIDMKDSSPKSVRLALINAANRLEDEIRNYFI